MPPKKKDDKKEEEEAKPQEDTGTFIFDDGAKYAGQFIRKDGGAIVKRHGTGVFQDTFMTFDGQWKDDAIHGDGVLKFASGATYTGSFYEGKFDGQGTYEWPDGSRYEGQWRFNRMHGEGQYADVTGHLYAGRFYNGTGPGLKQQVQIQAVGTIAAQAA